MSFFYIKICVELAFGSGQGRPSRSRKESRRFQAAEAAASCDGPHNWQCWLVLASRDGGGRAVLGGIGWYWPGGEGRYWAVLGGIGLSGFPDFREWRLWRALGNAGGSGIGRYWVVLAFLGGPVLGGIGLFWRAGIVWYWLFFWGGGGWWGVLGGIGWYWPFGGEAELGSIRRYWVVLAFPVGGKERG